MPFNRMTRSITLLHLNIVTLSDCIKLVKLIKVSLVKIYRLKCASDPQNKEGGDELPGPRRGGLPGFALNICVCSLSQNEW